MASSGGAWVPMAQRILKQALSAGSRMTEAVMINISAASRIRAEPIPVRSTVLGHGAGTHPIHPVALRRQLKRSGINSARSYHRSAARVTKSFVSSTATANANSASNGFRATLRRFFGTVRASAQSVPRYVERAASLQSKIGTQAVWRTAGHVPFASTLRPSLTGGALPRTASGYAAGAAGRGGARYFSHGPAAPAQVVQNVSQAMRAFWLSGQRARFDGTDGHGRACYRAIGAREEEAARRLAEPALPPLAPGAFVDFVLSPTITALAPLAAAATMASTSTGSHSTVSAAFPAKMATGLGFAPAPRPTTLGTEGFLDVLGVDFSRALRELGVIMGDLRRLAGLGDLPVLLETGAVLRVRFPGVDAATVERLCVDLGVTRGLVGQDADFDATVGTATALRFPFAPDAEETAATLTSPGGSTRSRESSALDGVYEDVDDGYDDYDYDCNYDLLDGDSAGTGHGNSPWLSLPPSSQYGERYAQRPSAPGSVALDGVEGVYRFLEACDQAQVHVRV